MNWPCIAKGGPFKINHSQSTLHVLLWSMENFRTTAVCNCKALWFPELYKTFNSWSTVVQWQNPCQKSFHIYALCRSWCAICNTSTASTAAFETEHAHDWRDSKKQACVCRVYTCKVSKLDRQHIFDNHQRRIKFMHVQKIWISVRKKKSIKSMHAHNVGLNVNMMSMQLLAYIHIILQIIDQIEKLKCKYTGWSSNMLLKR